MAAPGRVVVLMATLDGAEFLRAQLDSIAGQEGVDWRLVWRDDGSGDDTVAILRDFAAGQPAGRVEHLAAPAGRVGSAASFLALLRHVAPGLAEGDVVAFADQDDVWLPGKLARAVAALEGAGPVLYSARQVLVDAALNPLGESEAVRRAPGFPAALTQNLATGCTVAMNVAAARLIAGSRAPATCQHDWWAYLLVTAAGGRFIADAEPVVLYRQHARNAVGAPRGFLRRGWAALRRGPGVFMGVLRANVAALEAQAAMLTPAARQDLAVVAEGLRGGPVRRWRALRLAGLRRQSWAEDVLFRVWFLLG